MSSSSDTRNMLYTHKNPPCIKRILTSDVRRHGVACFDQIDEYPNKIHKASGACTIILFILLNVLILVLRVLNVYAQPTQYYYTTVRISL